MKNLIVFLLFMLSHSVIAQSNEGMSNVLLIPNEFEEMEALEEILETMKVHEGFVDMKRSAGVFTPDGPSRSFKEVIEIHFKSMELASDWRDKMEKQIPEERRKDLSGIINLFYLYKPED